MEMKIKSTLAAFFVLSGLMAQLPETFDKVAPFNEGMAAVQKGDEWAFINDSGALAIDFRKDVHWNMQAKKHSNGIHAIEYPHFSDGLCMVMTYVEDIPLYGFINPKGELAIEHQFLNVNPFKDGYTIGIVYEKVLRGQNEFKLNIYEYKFHEVLMDTSGDIVKFLRRRYNIQMRKDRYKVPMINSKLLNNQLIAVKTDNEWQIQKIDL
ncbi:WG repeat protein [Flagellimonas meridianipacifica]|uniref:WG repeat protein n=2 Tax=Flagellimonas meridianipacifica TaxID=1080225 RepID=A0A2T0MI37_9FLAO|nr:WG repeat protein [Allomuricauda pacifica]